MTSVPYLIESIVLAEHDSLFMATTHVNALEKFRDRVLTPSLRSLEAAIDDARNSEDVCIASFMAEDLAELHHDSVAGYVLVVQSMWERGFRRMLVERAKRSGKSSSDIAELLRATWPNLHAPFEELFGLPLSAFDSYQDLDLLQTFGNAIRHGDGKAAKKLYESCPSLWINFLPPGHQVVLPGLTITVPPNAPTHPSFHEITLPVAVLDQLLQSSIWYWEDIEYIRCNSFGRQAPGVVAKQEKARRDRLDRARRIWTPS
jgi:hypothetical protein